MTIQPLFDLRRIIPRWRNSHSTFISLEHLPEKSRRQLLIFDREYFDSKLWFWKSSNEIEDGIEVVLSSLTQGFYADGVEAADYLLTKNDILPRIIINIANEVKTLADRRPVQEESGSILTKKDIHRGIRDLKSQLILYPYNPLAWTDLAYLYILLGQKQKSNNSIRNALYLAPENRFVLRSAARLYIHLDEPDHAHELLVGKEITKHDPWLVAAEIAISSVALKPPVYVRLGKQMIDNRLFDKFHLSELLSAIATLELSSGLIKKSKKLYQASLEMPTENTVAQSAWAKKEIPYLYIDDALDKTPRTYEAHTLNSLRNLEWENVVKYAMLWQADEPYSSRPFEVGSYAALIGFDNYNLAEDILIRGLLANPDDFTLINNLAFSKASNNNVEEAQKLIINIDKNSLSNKEMVVFSATNGLILMRSGKLDEGRAKYMEAIENAERSNFPVLKALASLHFSREMMRSNLWTSSVAQAFASKSIEGLFNKDVLWLFQKIFLQVDNLN